MAQGRGEFGYGSLDKPPVNPFGDPNQISGDEGIGGGDYQDGPEGQGDYSTFSSQVSAGIIKINSSVTSLEKTVRQLGTQNDTMQLRNRIKAIMQQTTGQIHQTHTSLKRISNVMKQPSITKQQKFQVDRLNNELQDCIKRYDAAQKKTATKMRSCPMPQAQMPGGHSTSGYHQDDSQQPLLEEERRRGMQAQLQQQEAVIEYDSALFEEREEQVRAIEAAMLDVNEIFKDLSTMVAEQGEVIDSIEANIDTATGNVETGRTQLQKAATYQKKARKKMCCVFIILAVVAAVITVVLIILLK